MTTQRLVFRKMQINAEVFPTSRTGSQPQTIHVLATSFSDYGEECRTHPPTCLPAAHRSLGWEWGALLLAGTRRPEAADPSLLIANILIKESPAILRMWGDFCNFFTRILGYSLSVSGKGMCHVRRELFLISFTKEWTS